MSTIDYDPLDEEEAFTDTSLNAGFTELVSGINAIEVDAVKRHSLRSEHQPSLTPADEHPGLTWTKQLTAAPATDTGTKLTSTSNTPVTGPEGDLEVLFPDGITLGMTGADRIGALLVLANVRIGGMFTLSTKSKNNLIVLTIAIKVSSSSWRNISRTRRSLSMPDQAELSYRAAGAGADELKPAESFQESVNFDIPLRTLIDLNDLAEGDSVVYGVKVNIRGAQANTGAPADTWIDSLNTGVSLSAYYSVAQANLSVIPFHALAVMN